MPKWAAFLSIFNDILVFLRKVNKRNRIIDFALKLRYKCANTPTLRILGKNPKLFLSSIGNHPVIDIHSHYKIIATSRNTDTQRIPETLVLRIANKPEATRVQSRIKIEDRFKIIGQRPILDHDNFIWRNGLVKNAVKTT